MDSYMLKQLMLEHKAVVTAKRVLQRSEQLNTTNLLDEIQNIQGIRVASRLDSSSDNLIQQLIKNSSQNAAFRSRIAEIVFVATRSKFLIEKKVERLKRLLSLEFSEELLQVFRTASDRAMLVEEVVKDLSMYVDSIKHLTEAATVILSDIDKNSWSEKLVLEAVTLYTQRDSVL